MELDSLLAQVSARYGLSVDAPVEWLVGGEWNRVVRLGTDRGPVVLRVAHRSITLASVAYSHGVMRFMNERFPQVAAPLTQRDGETVLQHEGRIVSLFPFLPGERASAAAEGFAGSAAPMLAHLHRAGLDCPSGPHPVFRPLRALDWERNHLWSWETVGALLTGLDAPLESATAQAREHLRAFRAALNRERLDLPAELTAFRRWIERLAASDRAPVASIIHGDYYPDNVLQQDGRISGVIDWDECRPEWLVYELARATWEFCSQGDSLDRTAARDFLSAYLQQGGPVSEHELDLVVPFIRYTRLEDALFDLNAALRGGTWDEETTQYHLENLRAMEALRDQAAAL